MRRRDRRSVPCRRRSWPLRRAPRSAFGASGTGRSLVPGGSPIDRRISRLSGNMRDDAGRQPTRRRHIPTVSLRVDPGEWRNHVERGTTFGMAVRFGQIALDRAAAVLHQSMADEARHRAGAGRFPAGPGVEAWMASGRRSPRRPASALRRGRVGRSIGPLSGVGPGWTAAVVPGEGGSPGPSSSGGGIIEAPTRARPEH